jgi:hypothetical protein
LRGNVWKRCLEEMKGKESVGSFFGVREGELVDSKKQIPLILMSSKVRKFRWLSENVLGGFLLSSFE